MKNIFEILPDLIKAGEPIALATIIKTMGSTPRKIESKMVVMKEGGLRNGGKRRYLLIMRNLSEFLHWRRTV